MKDARDQVFRVLRHETGDGRRLTDPESLARRLEALGVLIPPEDLLRFATHLLRGPNHVGEHSVPSVVLDVIRSLLRGRSPAVACDPWAGLGLLATAVADAVQAKTMSVCTRDEENAEFGRALTPDLDWHSGDPVSFLEKLPGPLDLVVSLPPFGSQYSQPAELKTATGETVRLPRDLASVLIATASARLSREGVGIFVVAAGFFVANWSVLRDLPRLGLGVEAALALPAGLFAPPARVTSYLVVVRRKPLAQMFVAQLSQDAHTNEQIVANFQDGKVDGPLELGRFVSADDFRGIEALRFAEEFEDTHRRFGAPAVRLGELAVEIRLGRPGDEFSFPPSENALYIPLIGISDVVDSTEAMTLKRQNYAQVVVHSAQSDARFVARFLNSELGRRIRDTAKVGATIPRLTSSGLLNLSVFVPDLATQQRVLEIEASVAAERNALLGLQNDLDTLRRELWTSPGQCEDIAPRVKQFSRRLTQGTAQPASATLEQWFETLPFPLASILRVWQATPTHDFKAKYEHLLHFFEAAAGFIAVVYLSAFASRPELFAEHRKRLQGAWEKQGLSLQRATFGTWKVVNEYLSKQTRDLLSGSPEERVLCGELFADPRRTLPEMLAQKDLVTLLATANQRRNDWIHGGRVGTTEAKLRSEQLLTKLQKLRAMTADSWRQVELLKCELCRPSRGAFENEVEVLVGSNSEFLKQSRSMSTWLDVEPLYLASRDSGQALKLQPLIRLRSPTNSSRNACYFFNRVDRNGARFVSYHCVDESEFWVPAHEFDPVIRYLSEGDTVDDH